MLAISNIISIDIDDINKKITELDARYNSNASADAAWRVQTYPQLRQVLEATKSLRLRDAVGIQEGLLKVQAAEDAKNPEVIGATIAQARASAAASNAQAVASLANAEKIRADIARAAELDPINSAILKAQLTVAESQAEQASYNTSKLQNKSLIEDKYLKGEITREQFAEQSAILSDKFFEYEQSAVAKAQLDLARSRQAFEQANADRAFGVTQRQLALQEQTAALAQTQAVAQNAVEQARLDLQRTAEARAVAQARAQNMQALTAAQTQRQAAYNQAATEYERFGVATPNRIQGLQDLKAPIPAAQAAGMLGLDVNSPEFKAVYDTYSMALAPGQGAQQPTQPAPAAPAPGPNPVTNSIPLISMPTMGNTPYLTQALGGLKTGYSPA